MSKQIWEIVDFLSPRPKLYIKGKDSYTSKFAAFMSILTFLSVSTLAGYFVINFLSRREFNAVITKEKDPYNLIDVNNSTLLLKLVDINNTPMDPRVTIITVMLWQGKDNKNTPVSLKLEQCDLQKHIDKERRYLYQNINITQFLCIKRDNVNLTLYQTVSGAYSYFNIYIVECLNSTENGNFCLPKKDIEKQLKDTVYYLEYYFISYGVDHRNYSEPISENLYYKRQKIYYEFFFEYYDYFKKIIYISDNGNVFEDLWKYEGIQYDSAESYAALRPTGTKTAQPAAYTQFRIVVNSNEIDNYRRTYPKLQVLAANIGGVVKFCLTVADFFTKYFTSKFFNLELINLFFHFPKNIINAKVTKRHDFNKCSTKNNLLRHL